MSPHDEEEKKLLGSGGYVYAKLTEQEEIKAKPWIVFTSFGECKEIKCGHVFNILLQRIQKEYAGSPVIHYETGNEELPGEGLILTSASKSYISPQSFVISAIAILFSFFSKTVAFILMIFKTTFASTTISMMSLFDFSKWSGLNTRSILSF